jgi:hypothetical protein
VLAGVDPACCALCELPNSAAQLAHLDPLCSPANSRTADQLYKSTPAASSTSHAVSGQRDAIASRCHKYLSKAIRRRL